MSPSAHIGVCGELTVLTSHPGEASVCLSPGALLGLDKLGAWTGKTQELSVRKTGEALMSPHEAAAHKKSHYRKAPSSALQHEAQLAWWSSAMSRLPTAGDNYCMFVQVATLKQ